MLLGYAIQIILSGAFSYLLFRFFKKKLGYSLIFVFLTLFLLNFIMGLLGNIILIIYIPLGLIFKFHSKKPKLQKFLKNLTIVTLSIFLAISILGLALKLILNKEQLDILIKVAAITFWSSLLLMFFELKKTKNSSPNNE